MALSLEVLKKGRVLLITSSSQNRRCNVKNYCGEKEPFQILSSHDSTPSK